MNRSQIRRTQDVMSTMHPTPSSNRHSLHLSEPEAIQLGIDAFSALFALESLRDRFMALTGFDADDLRSSLASPEGQKALATASLDFLAQHEPDLLAIASELDTSPERLVAAWQCLNAEFDIS